MGRTLEVVLGMRGGTWVADGAGLHARAGSLDALDREIARQLRAAGRYPPGSTVRVFMACERTVIPEWMRAYQSHWFNRDVSLTL